MADRAKGRDNGVLLLVAKQDKRVRIEVGTGLEGALPDLLASRIIEEYITPAFKSNLFAEGLDLGARVIIASIKNEPPPEISPFNLAPWAKSDTAVMLSVLYSLLLGMWASKNKPHKFFTLLPASLGAAAAGWYADNPIIAIISLFLAPIAFPLGYYGIKIMSSNAGKVCLAAALLTAASRK